MNRVDLLLQMLLSILTLSLVTVLSEVIIPIDTLKLQSTYVSFTFNH